MTISTNCTEDNDEGMIKYEIFFITPISSSLPNCLNASWGKANECLFLQISFDTSALSPILNSVLLCCCTSRDILQLYCLVFSSFPCSCFYACIIYNLAWKSNNIVTNKQTNKSCRYIINLHQSCYFEMRIVLLYSTQSDTWPIVQHNVCEIV